MSFNFSYLECVLGFVGTDVQNSINKETLFDDVDSSIGLHDYEISVELRSFSESYWSNKFIGVFTKHLDGGFAVFDLISSDVQSSAYSVTHSLQKEIGLEWSGLILGSAVKDVAVLDIEIVDEFKRVFHSESEVVKLDEKSLFGNEMSYDRMEEGRKMSIEGGKGEVKLLMELREDKSRDETRISDLTVKIKLSKINSHFHTKYV